MKEEETSSESGQEEMTPTAIFEYVEKLGNDLVRNARIAQAMIDEAKEQGIEIDITQNEVLNRFKPRATNEVTLINLREQLMAIISDLAEQGVHMTEADLKKRFEKMKRRGWEHIGTVPWEKVAIGAG